jgi:hypothetical protein
LLSKLFGAGCGGGRHREIFGSAIQWRSRSGYCDFSACGAARGGGA